MKKVLSLCLVCLFLTASVYAQVAKIVDIKGDVRLKKTPQSAFEKAKPDVYLDRQAQIRTGKRSQCLIAFDEDLNNVLSIQENSQITLEEITPGRINLPRGKIFSLIEDLPQLGRFEVTTPVAVAGVRGTGDSIDTDGSSAYFRCFQGGLWIRGLDRSGNSTGEQDLSSGSGLSVGRNGRLGDMFSLSGADYRDWDAFGSMADDLRNNLLGDDFYQDDFGFEGDSEDTRDELRDDISDDFYEDLRRDNAVDDSPDTGGGTGLGGPTGL